MQNNNTAQTLTAQAPFSQEAEEATLGGLLLDPMMYPAVDQYLNPDDFFLKRHEYIYEAMGQIFREFHTIDYVLLSDRLKAMDVLDEIGGQAFLIHLVNQVPTSVGTVAYAQVVYRASTRVKMLEATDVMRGLALDESLHIDKVILGGNSAWTTATSYYTKSKHKMFGEVLDDIESSLHSETSPMTYVPFPIDGIDFSIVNGEVIQLAGISGTGKSEFLLWLIFNLLLQGKTVCFVSIEMTEAQIVNRLIALQTGIPAQQIKKRNYPKVVNKRDSAIQIQNAINVLRGFEGQFHIITDCKTPNQIKTKIEGMRYWYDIDLVCIDHMYVMESDDKYIKGFSLWKHNAQQMQAQAQTFDLPYLVLDQLKVPQRENKVPQLEDVYGTSSVFSVYDTIYAIHREDHPALNITDPSVVPGKVDIIKLKDRHGGTSIRTLVAELMHIKGGDYRRFNFMSD